MKTIPIALQAHKQLGTTSLCMLLKLTTRDGDHYGFADLDQDVTYNDGTGSLTYKAAKGFTPAKIVGNASLSVDNTELSGIVADVDTDGFIEQQIHAGALNYADCRVLQVNFLDLTMGHEVMLRGKIGEVSLQGGQFVAEFRSLTQLLKQQIISAFSLSCRATFGDAQCKVNAVALWINTTVSGIGTENDRIFMAHGSADGLLQADNYFAPGKVKWLTGDNAGRDSEVEDFSGGQITLLMPVFYAIQEGDTFKIRVDCLKTVAACKSFSNLVNMRAEPFIPVGDAAALSTPGAQIGASGGTGHTGSGALPT